MPFGLGPAGWAYVHSYAYPYAGFPYPVWPLVGWPQRRLGMRMARIWGGDSLWLALGTYAQGAGGRPARR